MSLASGDLRIDLPLASIPGRGGLGVAIGIRYSSAVSRAAATWNVTAPTGPLGLGWNLPSDRIVRDTSGTGTVLDDRYYLLTDEAVYPLIFTGSDADGDAYLSENYVFWKIRYRAALETWIVTKEDGPRWIFGGNQQTPAAGSAAIEYAVARGNWIGASVADGQQQIATAWNLTCTSRSTTRRMRFQCVNRGALRRHGDAPHAARRAVCLKYAAQIVDAARRDLAIARPQNDSADWSQPRAFFRTCLRRRDLVRQGRHRPGSRVQSEIEVGA